MASQPDWTPFIDVFASSRFYRWHIDAALYDLSPPKVTTLYALGVPKGDAQTLRCEWLIFFNLSVFYH